MLLALERRTYLEIPREHRVRWREHGPEQDGPAHGHPCEAPAEKRNGRDGERHGDGEKPDRRPPTPPAAQFVDPQPGGEEHDNHYELGGELPNGRVLCGIYSCDDARKQQRTHHPAGHEERCRRRRPSDEEVWQPIRHK